MPTVLISVLSLCSLWFTSLISYFTGLSDTKPTTKTTDSGEAKPSNIDALEDLFGNQPQVILLW